MAGSGPVGARVGLTMDSAAVRRAFARLQRAGVELQPVLAEIGAQLLTTTQERFEDETGPDGRRWQPLKPATARRRGGRGRRSKRRGYEHILRVRPASGLLGSLTTRADDTAAAVGTNKKYGPLHQFGGQRGMPPGAAAVPARPYLGIDAADQREIGAILTRHLAEAARP